jgi:DHA1 family bicyclomycin/chloramphenicol resistance-like MFS transporter
MRVLQDMELAFHTNATASAAVIACFVFAVGVSSLAWGPFCDLLGRKPTYLASTTMYAAAAVGCIFAQNIQMMLAFRTLQGAACKCVSCSHLAADVRLLHCSSCDSSA